MQFEREYKETHSLQLPDDLLRHPEFPGYYPGDPNWDRKWTHVLSEYHRHILQTTMRKPRNYLKTIRDIAVRFRAEQEEKHVRFQKNLEKKCLCPIHQNSG